MASSKSILVKRKRKRKTSRKTKRENKSVR